MGVQQRTGDRRSGTRTIRVDVPTADVASDLTWHLAEPAAISALASERDGPQRVITADWREDRDSRVR
jgi:hypothetical protein